MTTSLLLVGAGGALGSMLRFLFQRWLNTFDFPAGTLLVNLLGCLLAGMIIGLSQRGLSEQGKTLLLAGFCGGFTTFSAFSVESMQQLQTGKTFIFFIYTSISIAGGLIAAYLGYKIFK